MSRVPSTQRPNRVKEIRKTKGKTALWLAERIGVREVTVFRYESGRTIPPLDVMHAIADALGCGLDDLFPKEAA